MTAFVKQENVDVNGVRLWTATQGSGIPLVLCHGGPGDFDRLGPVASMIDDIAEVHRYDQRGSGRSGRTRPYDAATFVEDLEGLRIHWGHDSWVVGGHSWGASLALSYALRKPERVSGLLYISGTGLDMSWHAEYSRNREARLSPEGRTRFHQLRCTREKATGNEYEAIREELAGLVEPTNFHDPRNAASLETADRRMVNHELNHIVNEDWRRVTRDQDLVGQVRGLDMPAMVLHGEGDPRPGWAVKQIADLMSQGRFVSLEGVGHYPWLERPQLLRNQLRAFLNALN